MSSKKGSLAILDSDSYKRIAQENESVICIYRKYS